MNLKDIGMMGGVLPALISNKLVAKNDEIEALKKKVAQGAAGPQPAAAQGMKKGGKVSSASSRADGCAVKGKTRGKYL
jgi:hypothetical protein